MYSEDGNLGCVELGKVRGLGEFTGPQDGGPTFRLGLVFGESAGSRWKGERAARVRFVVRRNQEPRVRSPLPTRRPVRNGSDRTRSAGTAVQVPVAGHETEACLRASAYPLSLSRTPGTLHSVPDRPLFPINYTPGHVCTRNARSVRGSLRRPGQRAGRRPRDGGIVTPPGPETVWKITSKYVKLDRSGRG